MLTISISAEYLGFERESLAFSQKMHIMCLSGIGNTGSGRVKFHIFEGKRVEL